CLTMSDSASTVSAAAGVSDPGGQGKPSSIQRVRLAISASLNLPSGGICSSSYLMALISELSLGFPATAAGPLSPPFKTDSREVSLRPPFTSLTLPWHL